MYNTPQICTTPLRLLRVVRTTPFGLLHVEGSCTQNIGVVHVPKHSYSSSFNHRDSLKLIPALWFWDLSSGIADCMPSEFHASQSTLKNLQETEKITIGTFRNLRNPEEPEETWWKQYKERGTCRNLQEPKEAARICKNLQEKQDYTREI